MDFSIIIFLQLALFSATVSCIDDAASVVSSLLPGLDKNNRRDFTQGRDSGLGSILDRDQSIDITSMSAQGVAELRGYEAQVHYAITDDGYYIHVLRLVNPLLRGEAPPKRPVVFNHGLMESSVFWLASSRGVYPLNKAQKCENLPISRELARNQTEFLNGPMMLVNHGYDVWLMSMRGTDMSLYHKRWDTSSAAFWDYSLDNFALGDVPAVINYVRRHTGHKKVAYVGHSQATFSVFALLSRKPHYADIIEPVLAVAPVIYVAHISSAVAKTMMMDELNTPNKHGPYPEKARQVRNRLAEYCTNDQPSNAIKWLCDSLDSFLGGEGKKSLKQFLSFFPSFTSHKVMRHFGQMIKKGEFSMYDHGPDENQRRYGQSEAPLYRLERIRSKSIVLFRTKTDSLSTLQDTDRFMSELHVPLYRDIFIDRTFNHFDLFTHEDARFLTFAPMLEVLEEFERGNGYCRRKDYEHRGRRNRANVYSDAEEELVESE